MGEWDGEWVSRCAWVGGGEALDRGRARVFFCGCGMGESGAMAQPGRVVWEKREKVQED